MPAITIHDLDRGSLAFDLRDLLRVAGEVARESTWACRVIECISRGSDREDAQLHNAYNSGGALPGAKLLALADQTRQVVDGAFVATHPQRGSAWLRLEAIDSSYWEVEAASLEHLEPFRERFSDVRPSRGSAA